MLQAAKPLRRKRPEPAWDIARLFPDQGYWDEEEYLALTTNHLVEFDDGFIEVLPMPTTSHQFIVQYLSNLLLAFVTSRELGSVLFAPLRVRLRKGKYREPDVVFMLTEHEDRIGEKYWDRADLVMEVVSGDPEDHERDWVKKRAEYARAKIPEYWIIDPQERTVTVLSLKGKSYAVRSQASKTGEVSSGIVKGFAADADAVWAAGRLK